ncbi:MAG: Gfo/Idh/MocA family oxidoreductase [Bacteroidales bacterium]|jgi:predicted dehydrogenase|nr:Gfo/Idh/MocA family oxidoreductase [Bacteroidales bacterium]
MSINRRTFIQASSTLALGIAGASLPRISIARNRSANETVNAALIGCRSMGWGNLSDLLLHEEVRCVALCDIDRNILDARAEELARRQGQKPDVYGDYRKVLDRRDVDVVIIGTPDHWHCLQFVDACSAGKDVYVEKPVANSIAECDAMVAAARKYGRVVQVGQQQRSSKHFQEMRAYLQAGTLGKIGRVHVWANFRYAAMPPRIPDSPAPEGVDFETWLGPTPVLPFNSQRFHGSWRMFWNYGGGLITDWGVHLLDMGLWGMDMKSMPLKVLSSGGNYLCPEGAHETFDTMAVTYQFKDYVMEWENNAGTETGPYGKCYGISFRGVNGTLVANRDSWEVYPEGEKIPSLSVKADYRDHRDHVSNFLECVKSRNTQTACTIENGSLCAKYAHLGNIGARLGGTALTYDDRAKKFNVSQADRYLQPAYRSPWKFPRV